MPHFVSEFLFHFDKLQNKPPVQMGTGTGGLLESDMRMGRTHLPVANVAALITCNDLAGDTGREV